MEAGFEMDLSEMQLHPLRHWLAVSCEVWSTQATMLRTQARRLRGSQREFLRLESRFDRVARAAENRGGIRKPRGGFLGTVFRKLMTIGRRVAYEVTPTLESAARRVAKRARESAARARLAAEQVAEDAQRAGAEAESARAQERMARVDLRAVERMLVHSQERSRRATVAEEEGQEEEEEEEGEGEVEQGELEEEEYKAFRSRRVQKERRKRRATWVSLGVGAGWALACGLASALAVSGVSAATPHDDLVELTEVLTTLNSVTGNEPKVHTVLEAWMEGRGWEYGTQHLHTDDGDESARGNLLGMPGTVNYPPKLLFSTHSDTVPPHLGHAERSLQVIKGRGAVDAHGVLSAMLHAADELAEEEGCSVGVLVVVGEEVDHVGAKSSQALWSRKTPLGAPLSQARVDLVVGEPTEGKLATVQKGMLKLRVTARGVAAHSGYPELGSSAISALLTFLSALEMETWPTDQRAGQTTMNVGTISGGVAANVVPDSAQAELFFRVTTTADALEARVRAIADKLHVNVRIERLGANDPFEFFAFDPTKDTDFERGPVAYNTDAPFMTAHHRQGGKTILAGPGSIHVAHTPNEHITIDDLHAGVQLYKRIARTLPGICPPRDEL